ncbi:HEAT repeat domain-containing protein [Rubinisphaera margarita]|uniref:HEAT repeat domain-containing protein n=1 Tax=Rubinisphaera margarita TaxID=2909586 RepID=UPI001EE97EB5|nr:HEAT repeat domain-containing protein [Rubinisphaera margarita]MCG6154483.1 HEAT repeat domain-containing protein [Rubinisphaera margarita]
MSDSPIEKTMRLLEQSRSTAAMTAFVHALQVGSPKIRDSAARAILRSGSSLGKMELIRQIRKLSPDVLEVMNTADGDMSFPLKQCLLHGDPQQAFMALDAIEVARLYQNIPMVLEFLRQATGEIADRGEQVLGSLVDRLFETRMTARDARLTITDQCIGKMLQHLSVELNSFAQCRRPQAIVEAILILADSEHPVARHLMRESAPEWQSLVWEVLAQSKHPGILRFLTKALSVKYLHPKILDIVSGRTDIEFQMTMIRLVPTRMNINQERNYQLLTGLPWLQPTDELWLSLPDEFHVQLVQLIRLVCFTRSLKLAFAKSIYQHASVEARKSANDFKHMLRQEEYDACVQHALDSDNAEFEAWGLSQLRDTNLPDKYRQLVDRLDSPHKIVEDQAREALGRFEVQQAIDFSESAKPSAGPKIADLLLKVNPFAIQELCREMANPVRTRRLRAAKAAHFMQLHTEVTPALLELLQDNDTIVKRVVAEILGDIPTRQVAGRLQELLDDSSPRVREAAAASLAKITPQLTGSFPNAERS